MKMSQTKHVVPSVFSYSSPEVYLQDVWTVKKNQNKSFSIRSWARIMGLKAHGPLYQAIKGTRPIPKSYIPKIAESLDLGRKESIYLETLVNISRAKGDQEKEFFRKLLMEIKPNAEHPSIYEFTAYHCLKNPLSFFILELTTLNSSVARRLDPMWVREKYFFPVELDEIKSSIGRLLKLNLITRDTMGNYNRTNSFLHSRQDVQDLAIQEFHQEVLGLGIEAIKRQAVKDREFNSSAFGIKIEDLPAIKNEMREILQNVISKYEVNSGESEEIYQFSMQFFSLTKKSQKETK